MTVDRITRRRALVIVGAAAASPRSALANTMQPFEWRGIALGADARLVLWASDVSEAQTAINLCVAEINRLEQIFSLYRTTSEITRLNQTGELKAASHDMIQLLHLGRQMNSATQGLFDPTIQPLWEFYRDWYAGDPHRSAPDAGEITGSLKRIGMAKITINEGSISCEAGTRITLNGIAQGYITDRVAEILRRRGWKHVLIDLGEVRALDGKPDGTPWRIGIRETGQTLLLSNTALATSAGNAINFDTQGTANHILNPLTGRSSSDWRAVTARHASAAISDALSTALAAATEKQLRSIVATQKEARIRAVRADGTIVQPYA